MFKTYSDITLLIMFYFSFIFIKILIIFSGDFIKDKRINDFFKLSKDISENA